MRRSLALILSVALAGPVHANPTDLANSTDLEGRILPIIGNKPGENSPGCIVSLLKGGQAFLTIAEGLADIETSRPLDADTQVYSASVAKQFTALAVAQLVAAGKLGLNDDIRKYLPELRQYPTPVTVGMLLHHTSGIRDMLELGAYAGYENSSDVSREEALRLVFAQTDTIFIPGTEHRYSNSGYLLLSEIVARASGTSFPDYMQQHVFAPLGMNRSMILSGARATDANAAHGYAPEGAGYRLADTHPYYGGAGGVLLTMNDLARYDYDINVGHKVWTPQVAAIMLAPGTLANGSPALRDGLVYAGGLSLNGPWAQHGGAGEGFKNMVAWLPDGQLSIHILCNDGSKVPASIAERIVDELGGYPSLRPPTQPVSGRYASDDLPVFYNLTSIDDTKLALVIEAQPGTPGRHRTVELKKAADGSFTSKGLAITLDPDRRGFHLGSERSRTGRLHFRRID